MKVYLLVEGRSDQILVQRLLPSQIEPEVSIIPVGGRSDIASTARSLLVTKRRPLALLADADAANSNGVERRRELLEELVGSATLGVPYKIILAVPEIEAWYFAVPQLLERLSGQTISPEQRQRGLLRPKEGLQLLFNDQRSAIIAKLASELTEQDVEVLRTIQPVKDLIEFLIEQVNRKPELSPA